MDSNLIAEKILLNTFWRSFWSLVVFALIVVTITYFVVDYLKTDLPCDCDEIHLMENCYYHIDTISNGQIFITFPEGTFVLEENDKIIIHNLWKKDKSDVYQLKNDTIFYKPL